ncbi:DUF3048 domain-containing protein [Bacillus sp. CECT 9360]|uniref:DUF3048 domain-containing protein n=1 Tax=Bacillus sp. CECT 9360 TaxID=2845821 RepID=UPI001E47711B|nr:DUF3048 domain-containing protein [Bacillus sp. CECT 9360]CAH0346606.1 Putative lipoprotein YerB [Bacillus sp. CECT 9360]
MKLKVTVILLAVSILITGCKSEEDAKPKEKAIEISSKVEEKQFSNTFPLSGIGTNEEPEGRAVAVMINNHPDARPQSGLSKADIVYEMLAEAEVTRFLAVYQSEKPEKVGPVRSARDYYIRLAKGLDALFIAHGYSPDAKALLAGGYVDHLNGIAYDGTLFKRVDFRKAPHNSYITYKNIEKGAEDNSFDLDSQPDPFTFLTEKQSKDLQGNSALSVLISYGSPIFDVTFEYDEESGKYKRFSGGEQTVEYEKETPVLLDNIFIIEASHQVIDNSGRRDINLENGGKGYLLQKGKMNEVQWQNKDGHIVPVKNGAEMGLVPGKTWVNIIPDQPGLIESVSVDPE